ncbi:hypothetical protein ACF1AL_14945 [Streptomyces sp. NPDC014801]|uniref:hypothetical protein n=1 Tax=Streptomyces sp. NPDC014801 TaxID=3364916 RepID=UPI0036FF6472
MARASRFPDDGTDLPRRIRNLEGLVRELAAAPRGANTSISTGEFTLVGAGGQRIMLTPTSPVGVTLPDGSIIYPPAVALLSALADAAAGALTTYRKPTASGSTPVTALFSPKVGPTTAGVTLQGGEDGGETAVATLSAAGATLALTPTGLTITLASGVVLTLSAAGIAATGTSTAPGWAEDTTGSTSTATAYSDAAAGPFSASITVPPTGRVFVQVRCTQRASGSTINAHTSWRGVGSTSGTVYTENDTAAIVVTGANNVSLSLRHRLSGLTPGETLTVTTKHRLNTAGTQTLAYRSILLEPSLT